MGADRARQALADDIQATLEAAVPLLAAADAEGAAMVLERFGDALRLGVSVPGPVRVWARTVRLEPPLAVANAEVPRWRLPAHLRDDDAAFVVQRRDAAESLRTAVLRICLERDTSLEALTGWPELAAALAAFDVRLAERGFRHEVELLLEARIALLGERPWTNSLPEAEPSASEEDGTPAVDVRELPPPSTEVVASYAARGHYRALVEAFAAKRPDFAEELADLLQSMKDDGELIPLHPSGWLARFRKTRLAIPSRPREQAAAATDAGTRAPATFIELHELAPGIEGTLEVGATTTTLRVFPGKGKTALALVEFGGASTNAPDADGIWVVTIPTPRTSVTLTLRSSDAELCSVAFELTELDRS